MATLAALLAAFAAGPRGELIALYTESLGPWSYGVISMAALATLFSTTLTVTDGYPRSLREIGRVLFPERSGANDRLHYVVWLAVVMIGAALILVLFLSSVVG